MSQATSFFFNINFQLKQYSCFWIKEKKAVCCFAHNKKLSTFTLFGSAHPAVGNTIQSFGSYWHNNTTFCHPHRNQPKFSCFAGFGKQNLSWLCLQKQVFGTLFLKSCTLHFKAKVQCFVDCCHQSCVTHNQAGRSLTLNKTSHSHIPWLWLLFNSTFPINNSHQTDCKNKQKEKGTEIIEPN